jgi:hypothetical protein
MNRRTKSPASRLATVFVVTLFIQYALTPQSAPAYTFNYTVADLRQPVSQSGASACPFRNRFTIASPGAINRQWSTSLGLSPVTILTLDQTPAGRVNEIESVIQDAFGAWSNVNGSTLRPAILAPLARTSLQSACSAADGLNTICFNKDDLAFTPGVLAFTRVITADGIGQRLSPNQAPSVFPGQILDADILVRPNDSTAAFATTAALPGQSSAYDLESVLTHETGHFFGFAHSAVWQAMMYPFVPAPGQFLADRPSASALDAPLGDDDRTAVRALYPDPTDATFIGSISGRILAANPFTLAPDPAAPTGIFGAQVVAVDGATGSVAAAAISGWSCSDPGPPIFDGSYAIEHLPVGAGRDYILYAEPLNGTVGPNEIAGSTSALCRNQLTDPGWPPPFACIVPEVQNAFSVRIRP